MDTFSVHLADPFAVSDQLETCPSDYVPCIRMKKEKLKYIHKKNIVTLGTGVNPIGLIIQNMTLILTGRYEYFPLKKPRFLSATLAGSLFYFQTEKLKHYPTTLECWWLAPDVRAHLLFRRGDLSMGASFPMGHCKRTDDVNRWNSYPSTPQISRGY
ncbi:MAG: hypothetical protein JST52_12135, partial [Bacteroidetes bacterium]|nr:hypothetical protein [Bacteroidota bacterium]